MAIEMTGYCKDCPYYSPEEYKDIIYFDGNIRYPSPEAKCKHEHICQRVFESYKPENVICKTEIKEKIDWNEFEYRSKPFKKIQLAQVISVLLLAVSMIIHIITT